MINTLITFKMKNFLDDDFSEDEVEVEEEEIEDDFEYNYTRKPKNIKFQEEDFDTKVAKVITNIHKKEKQKKFSQWVNENYYHLKKLYTLSGMDLSEEEFYVYMYDHK